MGFNPSFRMSLILGVSQTIVILAKAHLKQMLILFLQINLEAIQFGK
jgi:hypothetical protein